MKLQGKAEFINCMFNPHIKPYVSTFVGSSVSKTQRTLNSK
jgi:hypothetical protein